jgi:hypothetical protein
MPLAVTTWMNQAVLLTRSVMPGQVISRKVPALYGTPTAITFTFRSMGSVYTLAIIAIAEILKTALPA